MIAWEIDKANDRIDPPTKEVIERDKQRQLDVIKALRRLLTEVVLQIR
jgi:hypothetical protein